MKMLWVAVFALWFWAGGGGGLKADELAMAVLPEGTKWVMHLDVDAGRGSVLEELIRTRLIEPRKVEVEAQLAIVRRVSGMQFPRECHDVTLYGAGFDESSVCLMIHGALNEATVMDFLKSNAEFNLTPYNGHDLVRWRDKDRGRMMFGTFARPDLAVLSPDEKVVQRAIDVLAGKIAPLKPSSPLAPQAADAAVAGKTILYLAAEGLADLQRVARAESPLLGLAEAAQMSIGVRDRDLTARGMIIAKTDKSAQQMLEVVEGVKAGLALLADTEHAPARATLASELAQNLKVKAEGRALKGEWAVSKEMLESMIAALAPDAPASGPPPTPPTSLAHPASGSAPPLPAKGPGGLK